MKELIKLGEFEVVSNILRISDPCYDKKTWCAGTVNAALPGTWYAQVLKKDHKGDGDVRCRKLVAVHWTFNKHKVTIKKLKIDVGVDSGCCGIFDNKFYQKNYKEPRKLLGMEEHVQSDDLYRAKQTIDAYKGMLTLLKDAKMWIANPTKDMDDQIRHWTARIEDAEEIIAKGKNYDYSNAEETKDWVEVVSDKTFSDVGAGIVDHGCVSRSGYGDGSYVAYAAYDRDDRCVGVKILF